jgi:hypothetical protein
MPYDIFISYSRRDNKGGRITELKQRIEADYRKFAKEELRCFFDMEDILGMDDWRHRILLHLEEALRLLRKGHGEQHPWVVAVKKELDELK